MRPSIAELRAVAQPNTVVQRASGEHWAGRLYQRRMSIYITRVLVPTRVSPDAVTWLMFPFGLGAALVATIPALWSAVVAVLLIQLQGTFDCVDGELARWRQRFAPSGVFLDRLGHYVTDASLVAAVGVRADGGFGHLGGYTSVGLLAAGLVLLVKAQTDLVLVARYSAGLPKLPDEAATAAPQVSGLRRLRRLLAVLPLNRVLLALELTLLLLASAISDAVSGGHQAARVLIVVLLGIAAFVVLARLPSILTSARMK
jgi:phosphatidylglycerophosphate synthase